MTNENKTLPKWILIVTGFFAFLEIAVSAALILSPESVAENVDLAAKGVGYVVSMWAARQFALGVIFGYATYKKSPPMLTISYIFFFVMFAGDLLIGISQNEFSLIAAALVMCGISLALIVAINKNK